jgi:transposase
LVELAFRASVPKGESARGVSPLASWDNVLDRIEHVPNRLPSRGGKGGPRHSIESPKSISEAETGFASVGSMYTCSGTGLILARREDMRKSSRTVHVGVDVSKDKLNIAWEALNGNLLEFEVANDAEGHQELLKRVTGGRIQDARIVLEATGPYSVQLAERIANTKKAQVMVAQPLATVSFARAIRQRAKTDKVDARMLLEFAKRMDFVATTSVPEGRRRMRALSRHLAQLIDQRVRLKSQMHAAEAGGDQILLPFLEAQAENVDALIVEVQKELLKLIRADEETSVFLENMLSIAGIADRSAARILPELVTIPKTLSAKQATAFVGLDPRPRLSGTSRAGTSFSISKRGGPRIRQSLYMTSLVGARFQPSWKAYYERLVARGKKPKVARVALMRRVFVALWIMWTRNEPFNEEKFAGTP